MVTVPNHTRNHRTALFIDADAVAEGGDYAERVGRLLQSLNGENIKTDLFAVKSNGAVAGGVQRISSLYDITSTPLNGSPSDAELAAWAASEGYVQVLFSKPAV